MSSNLREQRERILKAGEKAVEELIKVLNSKITGDDSSELSAEKMKNAAAAKRLAFEDALSINEQVEKERLKFEVGEERIINIGKNGFAEGRTAKK
jgi:protoporphyrinogen oxidase